MEYLTRSRTTMALAALAALVFALGAAFGAAAYAVLTPSNVGTWAELAMK